MKKETINETENLDTGEVTQETRLLSVLYALEEEMHKQNSFKYSLIRGAIYGLGTVIGATILITFFGGVIAITLKSLDGVPFIGNVIRQSVQEELRSLLPPSSQSNPQ